ncbi:hypothetical protein QR685DRAFT_569163 [Neurospora intermedia]|uniref:Uncharacterized protein n=1 Tax=Neurospora intermedia TaxID=5142 RepID=A0ABR3DKA9_NEUIN
MCQRGEPDLWTLGNGETQRERRRKPIHIKRQHWGNRGSRCGSGRVALDGIHPIWSRVAWKAHVKATGASSAARICHMHLPPSRALVTFPFRTFQQGSEHRNRGEMMPSVPGRWSGCQEGRSRCPVRPQPLHGPSTTRRRQLLSKMYINGWVASCISRCRTQWVVRMQIQLQLQSVAGNLNLTLK